MGLLAKQMDVPESSQLRHIGLLWPDQHERHVRQTCGNGTKQPLVDPLMQTADVACDRTRQSSNVVRRRVAGGAGALERFEAHAEGKEVDAAAEAGCTIEKLLRGHEHQIRLAE